MKVLYIYRNKQAGYSIRRVFAPIELEMQKKADVDSIYLPRYRASLNDLYTNVKFVLDYIKDKQFDIVHITGDVYYLAIFLKKTNLVVTVHDIGFYTNREWGFHKIFRYCFWMLPLKFTAKITFISKKSLDEFQSVITLKENAFTVINNSVKHEFVETQKNLNLEFPKILHIGTQSNKNLEGVIKALSNIKCHLIIVGVLNNNQKHLLSQSKLIYSNYFKISDEKLVSLYKECDIVSFPSFYEGLGMPIIEAQSIGRPVVTSDISPMNDIAGNGAILVDPKDINSINNGFHKAISNYDNIVQYGLVNAKKFVPSIIVNSYYTLYSELCNHEL